MGLVSMFLNSVVLMWFFVFLFAVLCIRCLIYGLAGGTSTLLRILGTLLFAGLAYACWEHANAIHGSNMIDGFVFDAWDETEHFFNFVKNKIF